MQRIRKSKHVVLDRDGDTFHIIYYHLDDDGNFVTEYDYPTKNAREAAVHYAGTVAHFIEKEILDTLAGEGYDRITGKKGFDNNSNGLGNYMRGGQAGAARDGQE